MRKLIAGTVLAGAALAAGYGVAHATLPYQPRGCTFGGGGAIRSGEAATVTTGQTFTCLDGQLIRVSFYGSRQ
jgi:hypothetical protein